MCILTQWIAWRLCSPADTIYGCTAYVSGAMQYKQLLSSARLQARYLHLSIRLFHRDLIRGHSSYFSNSPQPVAKKTPYFEQQRTRRGWNCKNVNNRHDELGGTTFAQFQWLSTLRLLHGHTHPLVHSLPCENYFITSRNNAMEHCTARLVATNDNQN